MKEIDGIIYNDDPNEIQVIGRAKVRVFYPATHDENISKKNLETINRICNEIVKEINRGEIEN